MKTIVVAGALANKLRNGGEAWVRMSWVQGLRKLGFHVYFIEQIAPQACTDASGAPTNFDACLNRRYFNYVTRLFDLSKSAALVYGEGEEVQGASMADLQEVCRSAVALINMSGHLALPSLFEAFNRKVYIDIDPGFTQFWHAEGNRGARLEGHTDFFTIGENIGQSECSIPTSGIPWRPVRQPVVLEHWLTSGTSALEPWLTGGSSDSIIAGGKNLPRRPLTTVASWRGPFGPIKHDGHKLGLKVHEFRKFIRLPTLAADDFEIALNIDPGDWKDRELLRDNGWRLVNPAEVARGPIEFRDYVMRSAGEFSVAQGVYVDTKSGWFSDRSIRYLAAGKPVLVQDTGAGRNLPTGEGLLVFSTIEEAVAGVRSIRRDYDRHCAAASKLAKTHFAANVVLGKLMNDLGIEP